jgi:E3 SUMO-protein ligase PIAS1
MSHLPASAALAALHAAVDSRINTLIVAELSKVCRIEQIPVSGKKVELQDRLKKRSKEYFDNRAEDSLRNLEERLRNPSTMSAARHPFLFRPSPFYVFDRRLGLMLLPVSKEHRNAASTTFTLSAQDLASLASLNVRVLVYAAAKVTPVSTQPLDISFPQQLEIRVNENEVKANTRGIKNKSGTTKPVDITPFLRKRIDSVNKVTITYALTDKAYQVYVWLSKKQSIDDLTAEVVKRVIRKERTLADLRAKADDTDIITTSTNMKLKDPVSFMRIQIPCRGSSCEHVGCFDLQTYLQMQEQAPQWECPLCSKKAPFNDLAVDEYVESKAQSGCSY